MALMLPSISVSLLVGSAGSNTFARNRGGNYVKVRKTSANPQTIYQQNQRAIVSTISTLWATLSDSQRNGWATASADFPYTNKIGQLKYYSGFQLFVKFNLNLVLIGSSTILDAPSPYSFVEFTEFYITTLDSSNMNLQLNAASTDSHATYCIYATAPQGLGIMVVGPTAYKLIATETMNSSVSDNFNTAYTARFGAYASGTKIFFKAVPVSAINGQRSIDRYTNGIVT